MNIRRPLLGHSLNVFIALIASLVSGLVIYANKLMPSTLINKLEFDYSYFATYQHMGPYCLGIFTGYILYKSPQVQLPKHLTWSLWLFLPPLSFTTLFLTYLWNGAYPEADMINPSPLVSALYVAIHRIIWTALIAWVVFASSTGRANTLTSFLSHPIFVPLSRLSFSIYLVHLPIIMFRALNLRHTIEWSDSNILWEACGNFIVSLIGGYFINIAFESPFVNLEAVFLGTAATTQNNQHNKHHITCCMVKPINKKNQGKSQTHADCEDAKSAEMSSSEQSSQDLNEERTKKNMSQLERNLPHELTDNWSPKGTGKPMVARKALRPKQQLSVEKIFGQQLEPMDEPPTKQYPDHFHQQPAGANMQPPSFTDDHQLIYSPTERFYRDAPDFRTDHRAARPYATLARTSRFSQTSDKLDQYHRGLWSSYERTRTPDFRLRPTRSNAPSLFGESLQPRYEQHWHHYTTIADRDTRSELAASRAISRPINEVSNLRRTRHARYNTLTGSGTLAEWSRHRDNARQHLSDLDQFTGSLMIPRIDSSTLRRQQQQQLAKRLESVGETSGEQSILEEAGEEEHSESAML